VFGRLAGYEDVNDADRLCRDRAITGSAASGSEMGRFEPSKTAFPILFTVSGAFPGQSH
jgi:hypothetical protein